MKAKVIIRYYEKTFNFLTNISTWTGWPEYHIYPNKKICKQCEYPDCIIDVSGDPNCKYRSVLVKDTGETYCIEEVIPATDGTVLYYLDGGIINEEECKIKYKELQKAGQAWVDSTKKIMDIELSRSAKEASVLYKFLRLFKKVF